MYTWIPLYVCINTHLKSLLLSENVALRYITTYLKHIKFSLSNFRICSTSECRHASLKLFRLYNGTSHCHANIHYIYLLQTHHQSLRFSVVYRPDTAADGCLAAVDILLAAVDNPFVAVDILLAAAEDPFVAVDIHLVAVDTLVVVDDLLKHNR